MVCFLDVLARADSVVLQSLVGADTVRLVAAIEDAPLTPSKLREIVVGLRTANEILSEPQSRNHLIDLLTRSEAVDLLAQLGVQHVADPFKQLHEYVFRRSSAASRILHAFFAVAPPELAQTASLPAVQAIEPRYSLFTHQAAAANRVVEQLSSRPHRVMLHMPTGSGKTRTAMHIASDHLRSNPNAVVLWLAASEELCEQAYEEFQTAWRFLGNCPVNARRFWGSYDSGTAVSEGETMIVAGLQKLYARSRESFPWLAQLGDRVSLVVFDEAHQAVAPTYRHVVDTITARRENTRVLGLSATPGRSWNNRYEDASLASYFGNRKVTLAVPGHDNPVQYLIAEGFLAQATFVQLPHRGPTLSAIEVAQLRDDLDIPLSVLRRLGSDKSRNILIIHHLKQLGRRHRRIITFCATVDQAIQLTAVLNAQGLAARCVTAASPGDARKAAIDWYRGSSAEPRILINFGVLTTGFDAPLTSAALIARPTKSLVLYSQMVGRAIRGPRAGGNRFAEIATVVDTGLSGFGNVEDAFSNWEDVWQEQLPAQDN